MSSYRQIYYHIVFGTKSHKPTLTDEFSEEIYKYIWGIIKNKNCKLYRINGYKEHLHILSDLHPSLALADYVKDIKTSSSLWIKNHGKFPNFDGWAEGYAAFTISYNDRNRVIDYIKNQKEHHKAETFIEEYKKLLKEYGIEFDEKYLQ
jgi:REP element-mobilizing transposase RayT